MFAVVSPAHRHIALSPDDLTMEVVFASREAVQTSNWSSSQMKLPRWNLLITVSFIVIDTAPTWNRDLNFSKWGPNGDLILSEMGTFGNRNGDQKARKCDMSDFATNGDQCGSSA